MDIFEEITALRREGRSFVVATVVGRRAPVSAHLGDRAIVFPDGRMEGFIGGACSREIIRKQALDALRVRSGRLVSISPDPGAQDESATDRVVVPMTCVSEGAIDVFVEPFLQPRRLIVVGVTPVAEAVTRLARTMEYEVVRAVDGLELREIQQEATSLGVTVIGLEALGSVLQEGFGAGVDQAAVVASQGHYDDQALETILRCGVPYVGLVASRKRGTTIRAVLQESGVPGVDTIRNPAGMDLGARTPPEVALSILAEIVQGAPSGARAQASAGAVAVATAAGGSVASSTPSCAVDPVCGMEVGIGTARHTADVEGVTYYFCCAACRARFMQNPSEYRTAAR